MPTASMTMTTSDRPGLCRSNLNARRMLLDIAFIPLSYVPRAITAPTRLDGVTDCCTASRNHKAGRAVPKTHTPRPVFGQAQNDWDAALSLCNKCVTSCFFEKIFGQA